MEIDDKEDAVGVGKIHRRGSHRRKLQRGGAKS